MDIPRQLGISEVFSLNNELNFIHRFMQTSYIALCAGHSANQNYYFQKQIFHLGRLFVKRHVNLRRGHSYVLIAVLGPQ